MSDVLLRRKFFFLSRPLTELFFFFSSGDSFFSEGNPYLHFSFNTGRPVFSDWLMPRSMIKRVPPPDLSFSGPKPFITLYGSTYVSTFARVPPVFSAGFFSPPRFLASSSLFRLSPLYRKSHTPLPSLEIYLCGVSWSGPPPPLARPRPSALFRSRNAHFPPGPLSAGSEIGFFSR